MRADHPRVRGATRGSKAEALRIAADPRMREEAIKELEGAFYAETSKGPREALLTTFCEVSSAAGFDPFPLTVEGVKATIACLRKA